MPAWPRPRRCPTRCVPPTRGRIDLTDVPLVTIDGEDARDFDDAVYYEPAKIGRSRGNNGWRLLVAIADVSAYVKTGSAIDIDAYDRATSVYFPPPRDPHAAREAQQRPVLAQPRGRAPVHGVRHAGHGRRRDLHLPVLPGGDVPVTPASPTPRWRPSWPTPEGPKAAKRKERVTDLINLADVYRALLKQRGNLVRSTSRPPRRRSSATTPAASRRSCRACATGAPPDRGGHARRQRLQRRLHRAGQAPGLYRVHEAPPPRRRRSCAATSRPWAWACRSATSRILGIPGHRRGDQGAPGRAADPHHAAALDAAGDLYPDQQRPLRPGLRGLHALHQPDPALPRPAGAPRDQGHPGQHEVPLPLLPTPGEAQAKRPSAWRRGEGAHEQACQGRRGADQGAAGLGSRRPALQRQRTPCRRSQPRRRG